MHSPPHDFWHRNLGRIHVVLAILALLVMLGLTAYIFLIAFLKAGPVLDYGRLRLQQSIRIQDRNGGTLYQFSTGENRLFLPSEQIPDTVKKAMVAIEDERFFGRSACVDVRAVLRAIKATYFDDDLQGASTITQQLTRMLYLSPERTLTRKLYEVMLSCRLETLLTKDQILTLYLNGVGFGNGIDGIQQAAKAYFGVTVDKLSLAQTAALVSIPQRPSFFSPYGPHLRSSIDPVTLRGIRQGVIKGDALDGSTTVTGLLPRIVRGRNGQSVRIPGRSDAVLKAMLRVRFIDQKQFDEAAKALPSLTFTQLKHPISAPHFALRVRDEIESLLQALNAPDQWEAAGLTVRTSLDPTLQRIAEQSITEKQELLTKSLAKNVSIIAVDRHTRQVVAYVGNNDFFASDQEGQIDMIQSPRQPGSSFKPLVYAAAFERGFTPETIVRDEPIQIGSDVPKNYEGGFRGPISVREALARSRNIPAIRTFLDIGGEDVVLELGARAGLTYPLAYKMDMLRSDEHFTYGWPMAIGSIEVPLYEMVQLYATIADHGVFKPLKELCSVTDSLGQQILPGTEQRTLQAIIPQAADWVDEILRDSGSRPEGFWREMLTIPGLDTGAKTGTSNVCFIRDAFNRCTEYGVNNVWTMGYTPELVVGVWVGNADNTVMDPLADGLTVAAPVWRAFLERASAVYQSDPAACR